MFVLEKDLSNNALIVGTREQLGRRELQVRDVNWVSGSAPLKPIKATVKIRYKATPVPATVTVQAEDQARVMFDEFVFGATAGQGAVFYEDDVCLGGGLIADSRPDSNTSSTEAPLLESKS